MFFDNCSIHRNVTSQSDCNLHDSEACGQKSEQNEYEIWKTENVGGASEVDTGRFFFETSD